MCHLQGEFAWLSRVSLVSDHFNIIIYYCYYYHHYYLNFWCRSGTVRINQIPVFCQNISCIFSSNYLVSSQVIQILRNKLSLESFYWKLGFSTILFWVKSLREHILVAEEVFPFVLIILFVSLLTFYIITLVFILSKLFSLPFF